MMATGKKTICFILFLFIKRKSELKVLEEAIHTTFTVFVLLSSISQCQKRIHLPGKHRTRNTKTFTIADSLDPALSNQILAVSVPFTINIPCLIIAKGFSQIKQAFTEYSLKHSCGSIVWMQPTSVCVLKDAPDLDELSSKNDVTHFVICDRV